MKRRTVICAVLALLLAVGAFFLAGVLQKVNYPVKFSEHVEKYSAEYGVPESLVYAVIRTESGFDENAVSRVGAMGLMQLMPDTFEWLCRLTGTDHDPEKITDPETNIRCGVYYLSFLHGLFGSDDWSTEIAAYNAGQGRVAKWLEDPDLSDDGVKLKSIPIDETANHVRKVADARERYRKIYKIED